MMRSSFDAGAGDVKCDESGICELSDRLVGGHNDERLIELDSAASIVVDIAPIQIGHCLLLPPEHAPSVSALGRDRFLQIGESAQLYSNRVERLGLGEVVSLEHGTAPKNESSCVKHAHIHLSPLPACSTELANFHFDKYLHDPRQTYSWEGAFEMADAERGYVIVGKANSFVVGRPIAGIRQISRVILSDLAGKEEDVDWFLHIRNEYYRATLEVLRMEHAEHV